ncbi:MAG: SRPBCC family protein [Acidimicrobiales bacterium]
MTDDNASPDAVVIERSFDAPPDLIWQMWTEPEHFKAWYGPDGATIPVAKMDVRVGGARLVCMEVTTPGGQMQMWFTGEYREVVENERLVYTESMSDEHGNVLSPSDVGMPEGHPTATEVTVELAGVGGGTKVVMTHAGVPGDSPGAAGWAMALDKLTAIVESGRPVR